MPPAARTSERHFSSAAVVVALSSLWLKLAAAKASSRACLMLSDAVTASEVVIRVEVETWTSVMLRVTVM